VLGAVGLADLVVVRVHPRVLPTRSAGLLPLTPGEAMASLVPVALAKWESDELVWVR
jgi:hypothetical protein